MTPNPYLIGYGVAAVALIAAGDTGFAMMFGIFAVAFGTPLGSRIHSR